MRIIVICLSLLWIMLCWGNTPPDSREIELLIKEAGRDISNINEPTREETISREEVKLLASDGAQDDLFGYTVSVSGDFALIGAYGDSYNGSLTGSAYIFHYNGTTWVEQQKLFMQGAALSFGMVSPIGPLEWSVMYNDQHSGELRTYIRIGYNITE